MANHHLSPPLGENIFGFFFFPGIVAMQIQARDFFHTWQTSGIAKRVCDIGVCWL